jgi:hypothetical protein
VPIYKNHNQLRGYITVGNEMYDARTRIEGKLGYRLYDCVWNRAVRDYGVEYESGRLQELEEAVEDLQQFADEVRQELKARPTTKRRRSMASVRYLDESEPDLVSVLLAKSFYIDSVSQAALRALSAYAALKANEDPDVTEFRANVLETGYLSDEQATDLLYSHAARFLTFDQMRDLGVPLSGHKTILLEPYRSVDREGYFDHKVSLRVEPPGISLKLRYTNLVDNSANKEELVRCETEGGDALAPYKITFPPVEVPETSGGAESKFGGPVLLSNFDTADRPADVWPSSLVDEIYDLAEELCESYMWPSRNTRGWTGNWWNKDAAALFVLTGSAPLVHPIKLGFARALGGLDIPSHVVLEVLPWLRPESVNDAYESARRALNVNLRNQGDRKFDVVTFVLQRGNSCERDALDFRHLRECWNAEFPEKKFKDTNSFSTYFNRGLQAVKQRYYL